MRAHQHRSERPGAQYVRRIGLAFKRHSLQQLGRLVQAPMRVDFEASLELGLTLMLRGLAQP